MFKVSEVAEMLSVEKVKIFEALIVHDDVLSPFVTKESHLSYISEQGVRQLEAILFNQISEVDDPEDFSSDEDCIELQDDHLDQFIKRNIEKKAVLRNEIIDLKRHLSVLDKELRIKDEAILHFQKIIKDDMSWLLELEAKLISIQSEQTELDDEKKNGFFNRLKK